MPSLESHDHAHTKSLQSLPSPTLTNPEMVLPDEIGGTGTFSSPPRVNRPPSPSYLYEQRDLYEKQHRQQPQQQLGQHGLRQTKSLGLMSRKKALQRSSTEEDGSQPLALNSVTKPAHSNRAMGHVIASPDNAQFPVRTSSRKQQEDVQLERKASTASSSVMSIDLDKVPMYRYDGDDSDLDILDEPRSGSTTPTKRQSTRRSQHLDKARSEEEERSSAELSRRAELILENAKKRLNLMDQNLRGARALTAENLQRAASIQAHHPPYRNRFFEQHTDASASTGRELASNHVRGHSDATVLATPHRPQTAMARDRIPLAVDTTRERPVGDSAAWTANHLRGTRSQDFARSGRSSERTPNNLSPQSPLEALPEMENITPPPRRQSGRESMSPVTIELQQQMQQLKGRISSLREKAREDSFKRKSLQALRDSTPFTDAERQAEKSPTTTSPSTDVNGGFLQAPKLGLTSRWSVDSSVKRMSTMWPSQSPAVSPIIDEHSDESLPMQSTFSVSPELEQNPSGHLREVSRSDSIPVLQPSQEIASFKGSVIDSPELNRSMSSAGANETESDSSDEPLQLLPVAHEDREDAFDYHSFYLHSGMGGSGPLSDTGTEDSASTARGPAIHPSFLNEPSPETPETLRKIERSLHRRMVSSDSVSTSNSFATATEGLRSGRQSPEKRPPIVGGGGSDGADSGIALPKNAYAHKRQLSHQIAASLRAIPAPPETIAVQALISPEHRPLGLKDKALVFMLVESLKGVSGRLQSSSLDATDGRILRRRLEEARKVLEGISPLVS